jgi:micrococcal nuclease
VPTNTLVKNEKVVEQKAATTTTKVVFSSEVYTVTRVIDGDTIEINTGEHVRYIGIDTPETKDPRKPVQCFGNEAMIKNTDLVLNKKVKLEKDVSDKDKYGRLLRYVYIGDTMINFELVKTGYAKAYTYPPDIKYSNLFVDAQKTARDESLGLWGACNTPTTITQASSTAAPESQVTRTTSTSNTHCAIKGNISVDGEKIYHLPGCGSYTKTVIDETAGEQWFCSEAEAIQAGWRKAGNC